MAPFAISRLNNFDTYKITSKIELMLNTIKINIFLNERISLIQSNVHEK